MLLIVLNELERHQAQALRVLKYASASLGVAALAYVVYKRFVSRRRRQHRRYPVEILFSERYAELGRNRDEFIANLRTNHEKYLLLLQRVYPNECSLSINACTWWPGQPQRRIVFLNSINSIRKFLANTTGMDGIELFANRPRNYWLSALSGGIAGAGSTGGDFLGSFFRMYDQKLKEIRNVTMAGLKHIGPPLNVADFEARLLDELRSFDSFLSDSSSSAPLVLEDAGAHMQHLAANVMLTVALGKRFDYTPASREAAGENKLDAQIANVSHLFASLNIVEMELFGSLDAHLRQRTLTRTLHAEMSSVQTFLAALLADYKLHTYKHGSQAHNLVDFLLSKQHARLAAGKQIGPADAFSDADLLAQCFALFMNGACSLGFTLAWAFVYLAKHKHVQEAIQKELASCGKARERTGVEWIMSRDKSALPYTAACVNEILRLSSTLPLIVRGTQDPIAADGSSRVVGGKVEFMPPNTTVVLNTYAVHHDAKYWHDYEKFEPNRWIDAEQAPVCQESFMPFGIASRACLGQEMSRGVIFCVVANLVRLYQFEYVARANANGNGNGNVASHADFGLMRRPHAYDLKLKRRDD